MCSAETTNIGQNHSPKLAEITKQNHWYCPESFGPKLQLAEFGIPLTLTRWVIAGSASQILKQLRFNVLITLHFINKKYVGKIYIISFEVRK